MSKSSGLNPTVQIPDENYSEQAYVEDENDEDS